MPCLQDLPNEILYLITSRFRDPRNLINLSLTCQTFYNVASYILKEKHFDYRIGPQWAFVELPSDGEALQPQIAEYTDGVSFTLDEFTKFNIANSFLAICHSKRLASTIRHARLHIEPDLFMPPPHQGHAPSRLGNNYIDWDAMRTAIKWLKFPAHVTQQLMQSLSEGDLALTIVLSLLLLPNLEIAEVLNLDLLLPALQASCDHAQRPIFPLLNTLFFTLDRSRYKPRRDAAAAGDATLSHFLRCPSLQSISLLTTNPNPRPQYFDTITPSAFSKAALMIPTYRLPPPSSSTLTSLSILRLQANHEPNDLEKILSHTTNLKTFRYITNGFTTIESFKALESNAHSLTTFEFVNHCVRSLFDGRHLTDFEFEIRRRDSPTHLIDLRPYEVLQHLTIPAATVFDTSVERPRLDLSAVLSKRIEVLTFFVPSIAVLVLKTEMALIRLIETMEAQPGLLPCLREIRLRTFHPVEMERQVSELREVCGRVGVGLTFVREEPMTKFEGTNSTRCYNYRDWGAYDEEG